MAHDERDRWRAKPLAAACLRFIIVAVPLAVGYLATVICTHLLNKQIAHSRWWLLVAVAASIAACVGVERLTRRLLPLAALLKLSMLFPDRAPSRFKIARKSVAMAAVAQLGADGRVAPGPSAEAALGLVTALTSHDRRTRGHCERVRLFTELLGEQLRLPREARDKLRWAALLHDIGKLEVATEILNKPSKLTTAEWESVKSHPATGELLLGPLIEWLGEWGGAVRAHHERYDGTGYPDGLRGSDICRSGRMVAIADSYEVMTAHRAYKKPMATVAARAELARCAGTQFDPNFVRAFLAISLPRLLWAMGPGSLLMNLPLLRFLADAGNKGVLATSQTTVIAASAAAAIGSVTGLAAADTPVTTHPAPVSAAARQPARHHVVGSAHAPVVRHHLGPRSPVTSPPPPVTPTSTVAAAHRTPSSSPSPAAPDPVPGSSVISSASPAPPAPSSAPPSTTVPPTTPAPPTTPVPPTTPAPPLSAPSAPSGVWAIDGDRQATVHWTPPADDGGSALTGYTITPIGPDGALISTETGPGVTSATLTGLRNGIPYHFAVTATNRAGTSPSGDSASVTPAGAASAPPTVTAAAGDGKATVTWTAPADDGGAAVTSYTVTPVGPDGPLQPIVTGDAATTATVTGLVNGTSYTFAVSAANRAGTSAPTTSAAVTPATTSSAPAYVFALGGDRQATVYWAAPDDDGGSPVTGYTVTPIGPNGPLTPVPTGPEVTSTTVGGLSNGTVYTFTVTATNSVGTSQPISSAPVAPSAPVQNATPPDAPGSPSATLTASSAVVRWTTPPDGGSPITSYTLVERSGSTVLATSTLAPGSTSYTVTGLTAGVSYTFDISATNSYGTSAVASTNTVTPLAAPGPVRQLRAVAGNRQSTITWSAPLDDGGAPVTGYTVTPVGPTGRLTPITTATTDATVTGLVPGTTYTFEVTATNAAGTSAPVTSNAVTPLALTADSIYVVKNGSVVIPVLANDRGDVDPSTVTLTSAPTHGSAGVNPDGTISYQSTGYRGSVQFTYRACDHVGNCATASITAHVLDHDQHQADFRGVDLSGSNLRGIDFTQANLAGANLTGADLTGAHLVQADLGGAVLTRATLASVDFSSASAVGADLAGTDLSGLHLNNAVLNGADLSGADLTGADLTNTTVSRSTILTGANLTAVHGGPGPTIVHATNTTTLGAPIKIDLLSLVSDAHAPINASSLAITGQPAHGTVTLNPDGTATYRPNPLFLGTDTFTFRIADVLTFTASAPVTVKVLP